MLESIECLEPGGIAVHTTELDMSDSDPPLDVLAPDTVFYRRRDLEALVLELRRHGHHVRCNFAVPMTAPEERFIAETDGLDTEPHLRLRVGPAQVTSFGLIIRKRRPLRARMR